jgi:predicted metal-dependent hydrolase
LQQQDFFSAFFVHPPDNPFFCAMMKPKQYIEDDELGRIVVRVNARARNFTFRMHEGVMHVTVPPGVRVADLRRSIDELRPRLRTMNARRPDIIDLNYAIDTALFRLRLVQGADHRFHAHGDAIGMDIVCPPSANFDDEGLQAWLRKVITEALRRHCQVKFPPMLARLAKEHGLTYGTLKINTSRGRWGSCSSRNDINLSCYLMLLPVHLIIYVMLHELTHTLVKNHSAEFYATLDHLCGGCSDELQRELKQHRPQL